MPIEYKQPQKPVGETPPPQPKEIQGVAGSVFGPEESERRIRELLEKHRGDRTKALHGFISMETNERMSRSPEEEGMWADARNVYGPVFFPRGLARAEENINTGADARLIVDSINASRVAGINNLRHRETLAGIYRSARERLFPEAPEFKIPEEMGVKGSDFGPKESERLIQRLLDDHDGNRAKVLIEFMEAESRRYWAEDWQDAKNIYRGATVRGPEVLENLIRTGEDAQIVVDEVQTSRAAKIGNLIHRETLAKIYIEARKRLFPEAPEVPFPDE